MLGLGLWFGSSSCAVAFSKEPPRRNGWIILQRQPSQIHYGNPRIKHYHSGKQKGQYKKHLIDCDYEFKH